MSPPELLPLLLALAGPPAVALFGAWMDKGGTTLRIALLCQALLVALAVLALWWSLTQVSLPPGALGLHVPDLATLVWAIIMTAFFVLLLGPLLMRLPGLLGLAGFEARLAALAQLPLWYLGLAVLIGAVVEEFLYRSVALAILMSAGVDTWIAAVIVVGAFALAHLPLWGAGPALTTAISGACLTAFYLWHGDLAANILAHIATDVVGIVLGPLMARMRGR